MIDFKDTTMERKTSVSSRKLTPKTKGNTT